MKTLGFIGVGDLAEYTIKGLRNGAYQGRILLSPRNQQKAQMLTEICHCEVLHSNQAVVDSSDIVILSTRPTGCLEILAQLKLRPGQQLISVVAGVSIDALTAVMDADLSVTRAMPVSSAEVGASATIIFPFNANVLEIFDHCGKAIAVETESAFEQGSVLACVYTWYFELFEQLINATTSTDFPRQLASELVLGMANGAARLALQDKSRSPGEIAKYIAREGSFSKLGLDLLKDNKAFDPWQEACQLLLSRLKQDQ
jgi:pyrroline-5-carboxylate reductase